MTLESMTTSTAQVWGDGIMSFGDRVRTLRAKQGITAKELSARSGVPEKTIYRIETGEVEDPRLSTVEPLVKALRCTADEMLFDTEAFNGNQRLRQLFEETSRTSKGNQELIAQVVLKLNLADALRWEVMRSQVEQLVDNAPAVTTDGGRAVTFDDLPLPTEAIEYFKKHPKAEPPPSDDK